MIFRGCNCILLKLDQAGLGPSKVGIFKKLFELLGRLAYWQTQVLIGVLVW